MDLFDNVVPQNPVICHHCRMNIALKPKSTVSKMLFHLPVAVKDDLFLQTSRGNFLPALSHTTSPGGRVAKLAAPKIHCLDQEIQVVIQTHPE